MTEDDEDEDGREDERQEDGETAQEHINKAKRILYALDFILQRIVR